MTSRRAFLMGVGGVAAATLTWGLWRHHVQAQAFLGAHPVPECCNYVDHAGWMLTKADKDRLLAQGGIHWFESSTFKGHDIADKVVADVDACATWCLSEQTCKAFSFAKPDHPEASIRNRCWLKDTSQISPVPDAMHTSGVR